MVAIFAAYLLVLQAMLTGLTLGVTAANADANLFTQVLCAPSGADADGAPEPVRHSLPKCCSTSCVMAGGGLAPPPALDVAAPLPAVVPVTTAFADRDAAPAPVERSPRSTRAPPHAA